MARLFFSSGDATGRLVPLFLSTCGTLRKSKTMASSFGDINAMASLLGGGDPDDVEDDGTGAYYGGGRAAAAAARITPATLEGGSMKDDGVAIPAAKTGVADPKAIW